MTLDRTLKNRRPEKRAGARSLPLAERQREAEWGAQWSPTISKWIPFCWDGYYLTVMEPRTTRARALDDGRRHYDRVFHPQSAGRRRIIRSA